MSVAICLLVWGDYWERFGSMFIDNVSRLNPQPNEVIISSPEPLDLPDHWQNIVEPHHKWNSWNNTMLAAKSEWVIPFSVDDEWFTNALDVVTGVEDDVQIIAFACMQNGQHWGATRAGLESILDVPHNPMLGGAIFRRSIFPTILYRQVVWNDWIQWMEIRKLGLKVVFKNEPIMNHIRHPGAYSAQPNSNGELQCEQMRAILRVHDVVPGIEFPPEILK